MSLDWHRLVAPCFLLVLMARPAQAQPTWCLEPTRMPDARASHGLVYDPRRQVLVMYGGWAGGQHQTETWEGDGVQWTRRATNGPAGQGMSYQIVYHQQRGRALMPVVNNGLELWEWDGLAWSRAAPSWPGLSRGDVLGYDEARQQCVLLDVSTGTWLWDGTVWKLAGPTPVRYPSVGAMCFDRARQVLVLVHYSRNGFETWEWGGSSWTLRATFAFTGAQPCLRFDPVRSVCVLHLVPGIASPADTSEWNGLTWTPRATNGPPLVSAALEFVPGRGKMLLFGARCAVVPCSSLAPAESWEWSGAAWTQVAELPGPRQFTAMAYDSARDRSVLHGGWKGLTQASNDTWEWDGASWRLVSLAGPLRAGHAMCFDSRRGVCVLHGGTLASGPGIDGTWEWNGQAWRLVQATTPVGPRTMHSMAYDSARGVTVLFGGGYLPYQGDTWEWNGTQWSLRATTGPSPRAESVLAFDTARGVCVLFGGTDATSPPVLGDTWEWNGTQWSLRATSGPQRTRPAFAYDQGRRRTVSIGGTQSSGSPRDTWEWDGIAWSLTGTLGPARVEAVCVYHAGRSAILFHGGGQAMPGQELGDTWLYGHCPRADPFGSGCAGTHGTPVLRAAVGSAPVLGRAFVLALDAAAPAAPALLVLGTSRVAWNGLPLPALLDPIGMTGCRLWCSIDLALPLATAGGSTRWSEQVPGDAGLLGAALFQQAFVGLAGSNGLALVLGR